MKFIVESNALTDSVNWVSRSLSTRPIMTALLGIVIDVQNDVTLSASDLETSAKSSFNADIKEKGRVLVPGRLLSEIARALPNKPVSFTLDGSRVLVVAGSAKFTLPTLPINEYPNLPTLPETSGIIASDIFATAVNQVAIAAGRDESLPTLTGIHVDISGETISLAATDRYRLAVCEINWTPTNPELTTSALLRARTLADAARTIATTKELSFAIAPSRLPLCFFNFTNFSNKGANLSNCNILAPSLFATLGFGCVSINRPSAPVAIAALAMVSMS